MKETKETTERSTLSTVLDRRPISTLQTAHFIAPFPVRCALMALQRNEVKEARAYVELERMASLNDTICHRRAKQALEQVAAGVSPTHTMWAVYYGQEHP